MPQKKEKGGGKGAAGPAEGGDQPGLDPGVVLANYTKYCKQLAIPAHPKVVQTLSEDEALERFLATRQLVVDDEHGALGPTGTLAVSSALMGSAPGMTPAVCKLVHSIRMWRCNVGDDGAACIAEVLRLGGAEVPISYLELLDNDIGSAGARALGRALAIHQNRSLLTLKLDYNSTLGSEGAVALCQGLRTNSTLHQLHLPYCRLGPEAGAALGEMLSYRQLALTLLNIQGNHLAGPGLKHLCKGLDVNASLTSLSIADNAIGQADDDLVALRALANVIMLPTSPLANIDMLYNRIGERGATEMNEVFGGTGAPAKVKQLLVDSTLPQPLFDTLCRIDAKGGKKGGKKKKKKKKK